MIKHIIQLYIEMVFLGVFEGGFKEYDERIISVLIKGNTIFAAYIDDGSIWIDAFFSKEKPTAKEGNLWFDALKTSGYPIKALATSLYIKHWLRLTGFTKKDNVYIRG